MNILDRRQMISMLARTAGASCLVSALPAQAAEYTLKCGITVSTEHPLTKGIARVASRVAAATGGRVEIQLFPNNQLGSQTDMMSQLRSGAIELVANSGVVLSSLVPATAISGVAYAFGQSSDVWRALDGDLGSYIRANIEKANIIAFDRMWDAGFFQMMSGSKPIRSAEDVAGFKLRVPPAPLWVSTYKALGASPVAIAWGEVYTALQSKIVDGVDSTIGNFNDAKLYEVQKFISLTRHMWDGFWILANRRVFERLPTDLREAVRTAFNEEALVQRVEVAALEAQISSQLGKRGITIVQPDRASFEGALKRGRYYAEWRPKFGDEAWGLLQRAAGKSMG